MFEKEFANLAIRMKLPNPKFDGKISIERALFERKSTREYKNLPLDIYEISQILWSAIGINKYNKRTVPSAGAIYPLEIYLVVNNVENLEKGIYKYDAENNEILKISDKDVSKDLYKSCLYQEYVRDAPAVVVIAGNFEKTKRRYGERGIRYVYMEAGHVVQNVYLQCVSLNLGTVVIGAFYDEEVNKILNINEKVIALMPIGKI